MTEDVLVYLILLFQVFVYLFLRFILLQYLSCLTFLLGSFASFALIDLIGVSFHLDDHIILLFYALTSIVFLLCYAIYDYFHEQCAREEYHSFSSPWLDSTRLSTGYIPVQTYEDI